MPDAISKAVLITGCSTGIGRATAVRLASRGWTVYASARKLEAIADLAEQGCKLLALDVCDEMSMQKAVAEIEREHGAVGVLINNAGYGQDGAIEEVPLDAVRRQFETNVFGLVRLTQLVLPGMRKQHWGRIVNVSSMGGRLVFPGGGIYHATKYAVEAISGAAVRGARLRHRCVGGGAGADQDAVRGHIDWQHGRGVVRRCCTVRSVQRQRLGARPRHVQGADGSRAGGRRPRDREGGIGEASAHALSGDGGGAHADADAAGAAGPRLGRDDGDAVQVAAGVAVRVGSPWLLVRSR